MKKILTTLLCVVTAQLAAAQLNLEVSVHCDEAGTLFVKVQEQIEELGELTDIVKLTVTGQVNRDDFNVIRNQMTNLTDLDLSGIDGECGKFVDMERHQKLQRCILPTDATTFPNSALARCPNLESVVMPLQIKTITSSLLCDCKKITSVDIPKSVSLIESQAFSGTGITSITIPDSVVEIKDGAFRNCTELKTINILSDSLVLRGNVFRSTGIETFTLPEGVIIDGDATFGDCPNLKSFYFPDGLTTEKQIGTSTLWHCYALDEVRLPQDLTILPEYFFSNTSITSIDLPATVKEIGRYAYEGIKTMPKAIIPNHVTKVGPFVFTGNSIEEVVWSENCHIIPNDAFRSCEQLTKVTIPETVDSIQENAFYYCTALESIHLPEGIRTLRGTFNQCRSLKEVNIPSTVTVIDRGVEGCFHNCPLTHIDIPDCVHTIGWGCFSGVPLEEVKLPSKLRRLGGYAFDGTKLKSVVVPEGLTSMGSRVFGGDSLVQVDLPSTLLCIEGLPMNDERWKESEAVLICRALSPPYVKEGVFFAGTRHRKLYVPAQSVANYQANNNFNVANEILPLDEEVSTNKINVMGELTIMPESGLQEGKYDVVVFDSYWKSDELAVTSNHHPRVRIEEGAKFSMGRLSMDFIVSDQFWFTDYKLQSFINFGTATADVIDLNWRMGAEHFFTPSFDVRLSDIIPEKPNTPYAFYRYNSGARAAGNFAATWERVGSDETLLAGQGYAFRGAETPVINAKGGVSKQWTGLHHVWNAEQEGTNYFLTKDEITLPLSHYNGEFAHNRNWNFIGNPYPAYLDIRGVDYDGPMYIYNSDSWDRKWYAVSALDDEYVIDPMAAIFVQAADGVNNITFLPNRRQHIKKFVKDEEASGTRAMRRAQKNRYRTVYNISLANADAVGSENTEGESPKALASTRLVINPTATASYEIGRDLPMMNMSSTADAEQMSAELYTLGGGVSYAINERPLGDGVVFLGVRLPSAGTYTLSLSVKQNANGSAAQEDIYLIDNEENTRTLISDGESYTFTANAGTSTSRFVLAFGEANPTSVDNEEWSMVNGQWSSSLTYNLQGLPVSTPSRGVYIRAGKKIVIK